MRDIEDFHALMPAHCYRCDRIARCEKAHIIDHCSWPNDTPLDVVNGVQNLVPLCYACHRVMPCFDPGEEDLALAWLTMHAYLYVEHRFPPDNELWRIAEKAYWAIQSDVPIEVVDWVAKWTATRWIEELYGQEADDQYDRLLPHLLRDGLSLYVKQEVRHRWVASD